MAAAAEAAAAAERQRESRRQHDPATAGRRRALQAQRQTAAEPQRQAAEAADAKRQRIAQQAARQQPKGAGPKRSDQREAKAARLAQEQQERDVMLQRHGIKTSEHQGPPDIPGREAGMAAQAPLVRSEPGRAVFCASCLPRSAVLLTPPTVPTLTPTLSTKCLQQQEAQGRTQGLHSGVGRA